MKILHLEDDANDAFLIKHTLAQHGLGPSVVWVRSAEEFMQALSSDRYDAVVVDSGVPGFSGAEALAAVCARPVRTPVIFCSGAAPDKDVWSRMAEGATDFVLKDQPWQLVLALKRLSATPPAPIQDVTKIAKHRDVMAHLVEVVQQLSLAKNLDTIMAIVRKAARRLAGSDGATFVLREKGYCYYADEDAISPLWKGQRFPLERCISGWSMLNRQSAVIPDIYADPRIPVDAYRPTFVKSLVMVPIRSAAPIGAIGNYWARHHVPDPEELQVLEALANTIAVAMENVQVYAELEERVQLRTREYEAANRDLEAFSYAVSHDLRAPLRAMKGQLEMLIGEHGGTLDDIAREHINAAQGNAQRMSELITDLLRLAQLGRMDVQRSRIHLSAIAQNTLHRLQSQSELKPSIEVQPELWADADEGLVTIALENLLSNAWKYSAKSPHPRIEFGATGEADSPIYYVRDNGAGFDMKYSDRLFKPFQRLHLERDFAGVGVGLATVQTVISKHHGSVWAASQPGKGATFFFTLAPQPAVTLR